MSHYTTDAICLKASLFGESDKVLTLFSPDYGRLSVIAKGSRKMQSKFAGASQVLNWGEVQLAKGKTMDILCQYQPIQSFFKLRQDILKMTFATLFLEEVRMMSSEHDGDSRGIFQHLTQTLLALETCEPEDVFPLAIQLQLDLLNLSGYAPDFETCLACENRCSLEQGIFQYFSTEMGGVVCQGCGEGFGGARLERITNTSLQYLRNPSALEGVGVTPRKVQGFLQFYFVKKMEKPLKSGDFLLSLL
ncbi:MAG: DNA repair protein RecO [Cyanobacteria bacterium]|nr:DNA repair protein RecO [Cyanobacteriota bacterium]